MVSTKLKNNDKVRSLVIDILILWYTASGPQMDPLNLRNSKF